MKYLLKSLSSFELTQYLKSEVKQILKPEICEFPDENNWTRLIKSYLSYSIIFIILKSLFPDYFVDLNDIISWEGLAIYLFHLDILIVFSLTVFNYLFGKTLSIVNYFFSTTSERKVYAYNSIFHTYLRAVTAFNVIMVISIVVLLIEIELIRKGIIINNIMVCFGAFILFLLLLVLRTNVLIIAKLHHMNSKLKIMLSALIIIGASFIGYKILYKYNIVELSPTMIFKEKYLDGFNLTNIK